MDAESACAGDSRHGSEEASGLFPEHAERETGVLQRRRYPQGGRWLVRPDGFQFEVARLPWMTSGTAQRSFQREGGGLAEHVLPELDRRASTENLERLQGAVTAFIEEQR